jgi:hypothetical protein
MYSDVYGVQQALIGQIEVWIIRVIGFMENRDGIPIDYAN